MKPSRSFWTVVLGVVSLVALFGCQQRPEVPTIAPEPTEPVIVIVVTATSQPTLAPTNTVEPSITPIAVLTVDATETVTTTVSATTVAQATRPPVTVAPPPTAQEPTAAAPEATVAPSNFPAPSIFAPEGKSFRDGDTVKFEFASVGPLAPDQCYRFDITLGHPTGPGGVADYWVGLCGNQSGAGDRIAFDIKPGRFRDEANYGTLLISADEIIPPTPDYVMQAFVSVVRLVDASDPVHPTVEALSGNSISLQNIFFR